MSAHNALQENYLGQSVKADPGNGGTMVVDRSVCVFDVVTAGASETRTLGRPTRSGCRCVVHHKTDGGDFTLTVTGNFNEDGDSTINLTEAGQFIEFVSLFDGTDFFWRKTVDYSTGNIDPADFVVLESFSGLTATAAELNAVADISGRVVPITGSVTVTQAVHGGRTILVNANADMTITLAAMSGSGEKYRIAFGVSMSSKTCKVVATGAHLFGGVFMNTDTAAGTLFTAVAAANASGSTNMTFDGATTGGRKGDWVEIEDGAASIGLVKGMLNGSGTEATPFS